MAIKILAAADLHLGRQSTGVAGNLETLATKAAWGRLVQWAIDNRMDAVALAGDVVDQDNAFFESIGPLRLGFDRLGQAGIDVFLVTGNHDYNVLPQLVDAGQSQLHLLGGNGVWECARLTRNGDTVQLVGWSFPTRYVRATPIPNLRRDQWDANYPVIGMMHGELFDAQSPYCPISQQELASTGIGTWLLGHIHKPISLDIAGTAIHYPGSLQALSAKETGRHGFLVVTVDGGHITTETIPLSTVRYEPLQIDITQADSREAVNANLVRGIQEDARAKLADMDIVQFLCYDLELIGEHSSERQVLSWATESRNSLGLTVGAGITASVRNVSSAITPAIEDLTELAKEPSPAGLLAETILAIRNDTTTPLLALLEREWQRARLELQASSVYQPLRLGERPEEGSVNSREHLLRQCHRLLSQLRLQLNTTKNG